MQQLPTLLPLSNALQIISLTLVISSEIAITVARRKLNLTEIDVPFCMQTA